MLHNAVFKGGISHTRHSPRTHQFAYPVSMFLIDLDRSEALFKNSRFASYQRFNFASFYPQDYLGKSVSLKENVVKLLRDQEGVNFRGNVFLLSQIRRLGFVFNPVSFYFCYDQNNHLKFIVSEIENTPWGERFSYIHRISDPEQKIHSFEFHKNFHVSPFMPMDLKYQWFFYIDSAGIRIRMRCVRDSLLVFNARLSLKKEEGGERISDRMALSGCLGTLFIVFRIYFQAFRLFIKKTPFFDHPSPSKRKDFIKWQRN